jgi:hypothetical protein
VPVPSLRIAGHVVPAEGDVVGHAFDLLRRYALGEIKLRLPDGSTRSLDRSDFGVEIDRARLAAFINEATAVGSPIARAHAAGAKAGEPIDVPLPLVIDSAQAIDRLVDLKAEIDKLPQDAVMDVENRKVRPEIVGYRLDVYGTVARLGPRFAKRHRIVEKVMPARCGQALEREVRPSARLLRDQYDPKQSDRTYNLARRVAARRQCCFGRDVRLQRRGGPRDSARLQVATVIAQGDWSTVSVAGPVRSPARCTPPRCSRASRSSSAFPTRDRAPISISVSTRRSRTRTSPSASRTRSTFRWCFTRKSRAASCARRCWAPSAS